jgi:prepilin-type N-terminal cleavage/methylation domain-containing protein
MNIKQMKSALSQFRAADVSMIKDEKLRAKAHKLQAKEGGFTLLELLVVITLLATLATAALVAYEGIGENATATAAAQNLMIAESSIRNYRAIEDSYPNQYDNLANVDGTGTGGANALLADQTKAFFGQWVTDAADPVLAAVAGSLEEVGIDELQTLPGTAVMTGAVPNLALNESAGFGASELSLWNDASDSFATAFNGTTIATGTNVALSIVPSDTGDGTTSGGCTAGTGINLNVDFAGTTKLDNSALNLINDALDNDACTLVLALGVGKDVPGTTIDSRVAIAQVPTVATANVNPALNYARAIALFQVAEDGSDGSTPDGDISAAEVFTKARLIGVVDPEGNAIDTLLAEANEDA